jgi:lipopolysaccharide export system permease protein
MFIFLLQFIMKFINALVGKGLSAWIIMELITMNLAWMVVLAVPMSVLVATLMAFGGMSSGNEITAMKASGMSLYKMMTTIVLASILLAILLVQFNNQVLPEANHRAKTLLIDIRRIKPTLTIQPGLFSQDIAGYSILARKTFEHSNDLEGITIYDYTDPATNVVVTAKHGTVRFTPDYRKLIMDLTHGEIHRLNSNELQSYRRVRFDKHRIVMIAEGFDFERSEENTFSRGDRELSAQAMRVYVDSLARNNERAQAIALRPITEQSRQQLTPRGSRTVATDVRTTAILRAAYQARSALNIIDSQLMTIRFNRARMNEYLVEIHKKYAIPAACIVFVFIGAPLGIVARKGTFGVAASLSLGFFLLYWASLIGGEKLADRGLIDPWLGMWMANIVLGVLGIALTVRIARETIAIDWSALRRLVPTGLRTAETPGSAEGTASS